MSNTVLPSGFSFDPAAAAAHVMEPTNTRGVKSSRGTRRRRRSATTGRAGEVTAFYPNAVKTLG